MIGDPDWSIAWVGRGFCYGEMGSLNDVIPFDNVSRQGHEDQVHVQETVIYGGRHTDRLPWAALHEGSREDIFSSYHSLFFSSRPSGNALRPRASPNYDRVVAHD